MWRLLPELTGHTLEDIEEHLQDGEFRPKDFATRALRPREPGELRGARSRRSFGVTELPTSRLGPFTALSPHLPRSRRSVEDMDEGGVVITARTAPSAASSPTALLPFLWAVPGLTLAVAGFFHPMHLTHSSSHTWWGLHVAGLFAFPLVGVALMALFRGRRDPVAAVAVLAAFVYATAYTALDVLNGIGAGYVTWKLAESAPRPDEVRSLFGIGSPLGEVGSWALVLVAVIALVDAVFRYGARALPGVVLVPGALLVHTDHIFWPLGATGIALVGLGTGWLAQVRVRRLVS